MQKRDWLFSGQRVREFLVVKAQNAHFEAHVQELVDIYEGILQSFQLADALGVTDELDQVEQNVHEDEQSVITEEEFPAEVNSSVLVVLLEVEADLVIVELYVLFLPAPAPLSTVLGNGGVLGNFGDLGCGQRMNYTARCSGFGLRSGFGQRKARCS